MSSINPSMAKDKVCPGFLEILEKEDQPHNLGTRLKEDDYFRVFDIRLKFSKS